ncbi:UNVERIFIED_CONTAM: hypothetical protein Slati_4174200 [Sesamum latifolium]|uniref:Uncharacterized protein n=1 Tax=Sesamum latifolium TaxID=2727402 RepID=A0AAW2T9J0_9LAMI
MANLTKLDFIALDVSGINYLSWVLDVELHLASNKLGETIKENTSASEQDCAKAMILLHHHLHESLKSQYLTVKSPFQLWKSLKDRFDHQKTQYRERGFKIYSELISCLLVAEENNQLLLNNHHTRPSGSKPLTENSAALSEANATSSRKGRGRYHSSPGAIPMDVVVVIAVMVVASVKAKGKEIETNFIEAGIPDNIHIDASDFFQSIENDDKNLPELPLQFGDIDEDFNMLVD